MFEKFKKVGRNVEATEEHLSKNGFDISRKVGKFKKTFLLLNGYVFTSYFLYIDDVNKRWLVTSPLFPQIGEIRRHEDLLGYDFFDENGRDLGGKIGRGIVKATVGLGGAGVGLAAGLPFGKGITGAVLGGAGGVAGMSKLTSSKFAERFYLTAGTSISYGIAVAIKDSNGDERVETFDFVEIEDQWLKQPGNTNALTRWAVNHVHNVEGLNRTASTYKTNLSAIREMADAFNSILLSNA